MSASTGYPFYGGAPPHQAAATSQAAAAYVSPLVATWRLKVLAAIQAAGPYGATRDEIEIAIGMRHQTVNPRLRELELNGDIYHSQQTRRQTSGRQAIVWIATSIAQANNLTVPTGMRQVHGAATFDDDNDVAPGDSIVVPSAAPEVVSTMAMSPFTIGVLAGTERWDLVNTLADRFLATLPDNAIDSIVTDPPAGIEFMDDQWSAFQNAPVLAKSKQIVTKTWGENAGTPFARRATPWPTGRDPKKILEVRKVFVEMMTKIFTEAMRVLKPGGHALVWALPRTSHWTAWALEDCGFEIRDCVYHAHSTGLPRGKNMGGLSTTLKPAVEVWWLVRKPLEEGCNVARNLAKWGVGALNIDACRSADVKGKKRWPAHFIASHHVDCTDEGCVEDECAVVQLGPAQRVFHAVKPTRQERDAGLEGENTHPTVKSIALMRYLCRLITPPGGIVLDPFTGSGTTACAAMLEGLRFLGSEREAEHCKIAAARIEHWTTEV